RLVKAQRGARTLDECGFLAGLALHQHQPCKHASSAVTPRCIDSIARLNPVAAFTRRGNRLNGAARPPRSGCLELAPGGGPPRRPPVMPHGPATAGSLALVRPIAPSRCDTFERERRHSLAGGPERRGAPGAGGGSSGARPTATRCPRPEVRA